MSCCLLRRRFPSASHSQNHTAGSGGKFPPVLFSPAQRKSQGHPSLPLPFPQASSGSLCPASSASPPGPGDGIEEERTAPRPPLYGVPLSPAGWPWGRQDGRDCPNLWSLWVIAPRDRPAPPQPSLCEVPLSLLVSLSLLLDSITLLVMEEQGVCTRRMKPFPSLSYIILSPCGNLKTRNVSKGYPRWELDPRRGKMLNTEEMPHSDQGGGQGSSWPRPWCPLGLRLQRLI